MTPVPLDLPLRPAEATEVANLIFEHAERKPLTDELRNRLAARAAALKLETIKPYFGSLERDPVHPSAYYLAVDGQNAPQLLYIALATAPTSSIYRKPLLIGRMRRLNGPEMVISAVAFGSCDRENIELFGTQVNAAFYPQPQGARSTITVSEDFPGAFAVFRAVHKRAGRNVAALAGDFHASVWAAIRAGWRLGFSATGETPGAAYSRYRLAVPLTAAGLKLAEETHEQIRRARVALKIARAFDFELIFDSPVTADAVGAALERLREGAHTPQLMGASAGEPHEMAAVARQFQVTLSITYREAGSAVSGRVNYNVQTPAEAEFIAENLL